MQKKERGFTLIEIMVVVVIVAVLMGAVTLSFPKTGDDLLQEQADRFTALLALSQDEAILQSRDLALAIEEKNYSFFARSENENEEDQWQAYSSAPLVPRELIGGVEAELLLDGISIKLPKPDKVKPQVLILSSGEITPFTLVLAYPQKSSMTIKVNAVGEIDRVFKQEE